MQINSSTALKIIGGLIGAFFILMIGVGIGLYPTEGKAREIQQTSPHCPTEDSCQPEYLNGHWYIIEIVP